jgi:hypothetical protein
LFAGKSSSLEHRPGCQYLITPSSLDVIELAKVCRYQLAPNGIEYAGTASSGTILGKSISLRNLIFEAVATDPTTLASTTILRFAAAPTMTAMGVPIHPQCLVS